MSSAKWRNAIIILLLLAGLIFVVENILDFFITYSDVPDTGIQDVKESLISIFRVFTVFALAVAVILVPVWLYRHWQERRSGKFSLPKDVKKPEKKKSYKPEKYSSKNDEKTEDEYMEFLNEPED